MGGQQFFGAFDSKLVDMGAEMQFELCGHLAHKVGRLLWGDIVVWRSGEQLFCLFGRQPACGLRCALESCQETLFGEHLADMVLSAGHEMVAEAEQQQRCPAGDGLGAHGPAASGNASHHRVERAVDDIGCQILDQRVRAAEVETGIGHRQIKPCQDDVLSVCGVLQRAVWQQQPPAVESGFVGDCAAVQLHGLCHKTAHVHTAADRVAHGSPFLSDLVGAEGGLCEERVGAPFFFGDVFPLGIESCQLCAAKAGLDVEKIQLSATENFFATQHYALHQRLHGLLGGGRDRHGDAQRAADRAVFAQQHVEHDAVDRVVDAVVGQGTHGRGGLSVAVDAAFALFVAGRVPAQVVVHDGVEMILQVDAFAEAVGGDQQPSGEGAEAGHTHRPAASGQAA